MASKAQTEDAGLVKSRHSGAYGLHADTEELNDEVRETFTHHNRTYQRCAIDRKIYLVPVDEVIGVDVSPHHYNPDESVENLYLNIDNLNMPLQFHSNHFDLVNSRLLAGGIDRTRWHGYMRDILRCLRVNGWCQMVEIDFNAQSDNGTLTDGHALRQWSDKYIRAMSQNKNPEAPRRLAHWMRHAGFVDVEERMLPLPMCGWSENQRDFDIGAANQENVRLLLGSLALYPFTELLGMTITEFHVLVAQARAEASNPALKVRTRFCPYSRMSKTGWPAMLMKSTSK
ncbi:S-adenosyl-L-methionine-dependent methyltransferase [Hypomontagnella monticulosa]|nr:S-adenosyl-L-methionine-dependent methyltransferase [Hypomontagnella monticulosa]